MARFKKKLQGKQQAFLKRPICNPCVAKSKQSTGEQSMAAPTNPSVAISVKGGIMDLPFADVKTLLDMVLGREPFNLRTAIKAIAAIADYVASLDLGQGLMANKCDPTTQLAAMLQSQLVANNTKNGAQEIMPSALIDLIPQKVIWEFLLRQLLAWLAKQTATTS